jgi:nitrogen fixation/metabolism regulation signal transduction histidine kinase
MTFLVEYFFPQRANIKKKAQEMSTKQGSVLLPALIAVVSGIATAILLLSLSTHVGPEKQKAWWLWLFAVISFFVFVLTVLIICGKLGMEVRRGRKVSRYAARV